MKFRDINAASAVRSTLEPSPVPSSHNEKLHQTENESRSPLQTENESRFPELEPDQCQTPPTPVVQKNDILSPAHSVPDSTEPVLLETIAYKRYNQKVQTVP